MKSKLIILFSIIIVFASCNLFAQINTTPKWYPSTRIYSNWEMTKYNSKFNRFINTYHLSNIKVGIDSICAHMKYIQIDDNFQICDFTNTPDSVEEFRSKILYFYHDWWRLFSNERFTIDSSRIFIDDGGCLQGRFFIKNPYDPSLNILKRELGYLSASVDKNGQLFYMRSSLVPHLRVPEQPLVSENEAVDIIEGYEFTIDAPLFNYNKTVTLTRENLSKPELSIYVERTRQNNIGCLKYRLVWRFKCREALIYVDAMTGEIIGHKITMIFY
jgi:hypothetical protein